MRCTVHALILFFSAFPLVAQPVAAPDTTADAWWKHAVIYEVYPRSFQDSDGDGKGDIKGIESRLAYLKDLGIDAIWITPMYPSPQIDFGYDISDYEAIDPQYGTMGDFDTLLKTANALGIRVIMDIVLNHTSDKHPWFRESRSSLHNPKRDWVHLARRQGRQLSQQLAVVVRPLCLDEGRRHRPVLLPLLLHAAARSQLA